MRNIMILFLICLPLSVFALEKPLPLASDSRIKLVDYSSNNVVPVYGMPFTTTQLIFDKQQFIVDVQGGDAGGWSPYWDKAVPYVLNLKLTAKESNTNMTVITKNIKTHRVYFYYFHLASVAENNQANATYAIRFVYPIDKARQLNQQLKRLSQEKQAELSAFRQPSAYNWNYSFHGDKSIMPLHVFDDGKFTYLQLQAGQAVPAVFAVLARSGKESVVNYRKDGQYLVIERVAPQFTLRAGKDRVASIFNNKSIQNGK